MLTIPSFLRRVALLGAATALLSGCGNDNDHSPGQGGLSARPPIPKACSIPAAGCPCTSVEAVKCGVTKSRQGDTLTCREGERACTGGAWGDCVGDVTTQIYAPRPAPPGVHTQAQATMPADCNDACDPYCQKLADTPDDLHPPAKFSADPTGLTLYSAGFTGGNCPAVVIKPTDASLVITAINETDGTVTPNTVPLTAVCGTAGTPIDPTWNADQPDRASIGADGKLTVFTGIAGDIGVTASSVVNVGTLAVPVTVNINALGANTDAADQTLFAGAGNGADPAKTLYPYKDTIFPLDLTAPVVQWEDGADANAAAAAPLPDNTEVALRFPAGSAAPTFWYSKIFDVEPYDGPLQKNPMGKRRAPAWSIPQAVWTAFSRTAKGATGDIVIQRKVGGTLYKELVIPVTFGTKALRGTVYYTQYQRRLFKTGAGDNCDGTGAKTPAQTDLDENYDPLNPGMTVCPVGNCTHADDILGGSTTRSIDMSTPTAKNLDPFAGVDAMGNPVTAGGCPVCHTVSANGNRYVAGSKFLQDFGPTPTVTRSQGYVADITAGMSGVATFAVLNEASNYANNRYNQDWGSRGFSYAPLTPDGELALQGPAPWGNTDGGWVTNNLTGDFVATSGGQTMPMFFVPSANPGSSVMVATTAAFAATRSGDVLTENSSGALPNIDSVALATGNSLLVKNQSTASDNGIYTVTSLGGPDLTDQSFTSSAVASTSTLASSVATTNTADKAFDNNTTGSRWQSAASDPQWLRVDLGSIRPITRVNIDWQTNNAKNYIIEVSNDGTTWTTVATRTGMPVAADHRIDNITGLTASGRYVRMTGQLRNVTSYSIWEMDVFGTVLQPYKLTRRSDAISPLTDDRTLLANSEVRVTRGNTNYAKVFRLTSPAGNPNINVDDLTFTDVAASKLPVMMTPTISPDGTKIAYVNGDADTDTVPTASAAAHWRKALTMVTFDQATRVISNKKRILSNWNGANGGNPIKWPFFEHDSKSLVYVQSDVTNYCHSENSTDDDGRACLHSVYGNAAPTTRGRWHGSLYSLDTTNPGATVAELSKLNDAEDPLDADKAYQPTVLPKHTMGDYRWVIFTSPRSYGNQLNQIGTHFTCGASMLWVAALDDKASDGTDRSHPAFFLPGQQAAAITTEAHYVNERGYLVPSLCKATASACSTTDECCGTDKCKIDSVSAAGVPSRTCKAASACSHEGEACVTTLDCCGTGSPCVANKCVNVPNFTGSATYVRDYQATCDPGYKVRWGLFSFHLTTPGDSQIAFAASTSEAVADLNMAPFVSLTTSTADNYGAAAADVDVGDKLEHAPTPQLFSLANLRISMTFNPSSDGTFAPILHDWEQRFSCVPAE